MPRSSVSRIVLIGLSLATMGPWACAQESAARSTVRFASAEVAVEPESEAPSAQDDPAPAPNLVAPETARRTAPPIASAPAHSAAVPVSPARRRTGVPVPVYTGPIDDSHLTSQTRRALGFYGGYSARATLSQMPSRTPVLSSPTAGLIPQQGKPFQSVQSEPTISPYLNLYRQEETSVSVPLYFTSVLPQQEQQEANRVQQREMQKLRGQLQNVAVEGVAPQVGFRGSARYMNTGQFYRGLQR